MAAGAVLLSATGALGAKALRRLQAVAVTTVDDLRFALASTPEAIARLIGVSDLSELQYLWQGDEASIELAMADFDGVPDLGAQAPPDVDVLEEASEELFSASLDALGPPPQDATGAADESVRIDCISCLRPVRDQGDRGTCVALAVAAVFECLAKRAYGLTVDFSPQFLYWAAKRHDGIPSQSGTFIGVAVERVVADGVCLEAEWPYDPAPDPTNEGQGPPPEEAIAAATRHRAASAVLMQRKSSQVIRDSLDQQNPVAFSIPVYAIWANPSGKVPMPIPGAPLIGGHAMCAAGYVPDPSAPGGGWVIAKNSWGQGRARLSPVGPGYYYVPFDYVNMYGWETATLA